MMNQKMLFKSLKLTQKKEKQQQCVLTKSINGTFTLREKFPSMYLINQNSVLATGTKKNQLPSAIGGGLEKKKTFGEKAVEMILINPKNDTDLQTFSRK